MIRLALLLILCGIGVGCRNPEGQTPSRESSIEGIATEHLLPALDVRADLAPSAERMARLTVRTLAGQPILALEAPRGEREAVGLRVVSTERRDAFNWDVLLSWAGPASPTRILLRLPTPATAETSILLRWEGLSVQGDYEERDSGL